MALLLTLLRSINSSKAQIPFSSLSYHNPVTRDCIVYKGLIRVQMGTDGNYYTILRFDTNNSSSGTKRNISVSGHPLWHGGYESIPAPQYMPRRQ